MLFASVVLVFGVALSRSGGSRERLTIEATLFALSPPGIMTSAVVSAGALAIVALVGARVLAGGVRAGLRLGPTRATARGIVAAVVGMIGLSVASGAATDLVGARESGTMELIAHALARPTPGRLLLALATIAIAPAVAEEAFFRGLIQTRLTSRWRRWPSIAATALGFALIHFDLAQGAVALVAGLYLGGLVERFGGIRPSIAAHACNNGAFVVIASFASSDPASRTTDLWSIAAGTCVWAACALVVRSRFAVRPAD